MKWCGRSEAKGGKIVGIEGKLQSEWVLVDAGDVVVHVMMAPVRAHYNLEELWNFGADADADSRFGIHLLSPPLVLGDPIMKITLLSVGTRMPRWVEEGVQEYTRRIQHELGFSVQEIPLPRRNKTTTIDQCIQKEGAAMLGKLPTADYVVALDVAGKSLDTTGLADKLGQFQSMGRNVSLLVGGPDGLHGDCLARADEALVPVGTDATPIPWSESWWLSNFTGPRACAPATLIIGSEPGQRAGW